MGPKFYFGRKDAADYNPYGKIFTPRQTAIINGLPVVKLKKREVTVIIKKAEKLGLPSLAEAVFVKYEEFLTGKHKPKYTIEEAQAGLQALTPWKR